MRVVDLHYRLHCKISDGMACPVTSEVCLLFSTSSVSLSVGFVVAFPRGDITRCCMALILLAFSPSPIKGRILDCVGCIGM